MHAVRTTSRHPVCWVAFSPCGNWFAAAQPHHGVTLHDRATGAAVRTFGTPRWADYTSLTFLRDGARLAAAGSKGVEVHDTATGGRVAVGHRPMVRGLCLAPVGDTLFGGSWCAVIELEICPDRTELTGRPFWGGDRQDVGWHLSPDGRWAVGVRTVGRPVVLDLGDRRELHVLDHPARHRPHDNRYQPPDVTFSVGTPRVAVGDRGTITVFAIDPDAGGDVRYEVPAPKSIATAAFTLPPPERWPPDQPWRPPFALTPDGRRLLVKRPRERVQLWDVDAGTLAAEWSWRLEGITCLAVAPDGLTAVAGGRFGRLLTWDLE